MCTRLRGTRRATQGALTTKISENYHRRRCHQYGGHERRCRSIASRVTEGRSIVQEYFEALCKRQYGRSNCKGSNAALCCALAAAQ
ncbi:hypothetical protein ACFW04_002676 [Cataglyphis niger]